MRVKEAMKVLKCSRMTVHNYIKQGKLKVARILPNGYRILDDMSVYGLVASSFFCDKRSSCIFIKKSAGKTASFETNDVIAQKIIDFMSFA